METAPALTHALAQERDLGRAYIEAFFQWLASPQAPPDAAALPLDALLDRYAGVDRAAVTREIDELASVPAPTLYRERLVRAFIAGHLGLDATRLPPGDAGLRYLLARAQAAHLTLRPFRKRPRLHRLQWAFDILAAVAPTNLLDVGLGDGHAFVALLDAFPALRVSVFDPRPEVEPFLRALRRGGAMPSAGFFTGAGAQWEHVPTGHAGVTTALEVLEHIASEAELHATARALVRVTRDCVLVSVPAQGDANRDHHRVFTEASLDALWRAAGARAVDVATVPAGAAEGAPARPGHLVARVTPPRREPAFPLPRERQSE